MTDSSPEEAWSSSARVAVVIPALDEEESLPDVLGRLPAWIDRVIVADNGSTDGTVTVARAAGAEVVRESERGYGAACLAGLDHLGTVGDVPDVVVFLDADGSDDVETIEALVRPIIADEADMVLGVRRAPGGGLGTILPHARFGNRLVLDLVRAFFGQSWQDLPPFRAIRWSSLVALEMDDRNWGWTLQMQIRAPRRGVRVQERVVLHRRRSKGKSKITGSLSASIKVGLKMFYTIARERSRSR